MEVQTERKRNMRELCSDLDTKVLSVVLEIKNVMKNLMLFKVYLSFLRVRTASHVPCWHRSIYL